MMSIGTYYKDNVLQETYSIHRYADLQKKQMEKTVRDTDSLRTLHKRISLRQALL